MKILKKYVRKRNIAKLATKIYRISFEMSCVQSDGEINRMKKKVLSYNIFNMSESNIKYFLKVTEGRYGIEFRELEDLCSKMENVRESILIGKKCRELSEKLFEEVPKYMYGILFSLSSDVYMTLLEIGFIAIFCTIGQFFCYIFRQLT